MRHNAGHSSGHDVVKTSRALHHDHGTGYGAFHK